MSRNAPAPAAGAASLPTLTRRNLPLLLLRAREDLLARFRPLLAAHGLTEQQWRVLRVLAEHAPAPLEPREIGDLCRISSPSLAGVLARMDETGLVARRRVAADARRLRVTLTAKSRTIVRRIAPQVEREYAALEAAVGAALLDELHAVLDRLEARLHAAPPPADGRHAPHSVAVSGKSRHRAAPATARSPDR